jgi:hypothetical protein
MAFVVANTNATIDVVGDNCKFPIATKSHIAKNRKPHKGYAQYTSNKQNVNIHDLLHVPKVHMS